MKAQEPSMWGEYGSAAAFYASEEWLTIVRDSYAEHQQSLTQARAAHDEQAIKFYEKQVKGCEDELGIERPQLSLF